MYCQKYYLIGIEDLREKREEVNRQILKEEEEKAKIQRDLSVLTDRLQKLNESLIRKNQARDDYDKTITETEAAYMKILESSQVLLNSVKREQVTLTKKKQTSNQTVSQSNQSRIFKSNIILMMIIFLWN